MKLKLALNITAEQHGFYQSSLWEVEQRLIFIASNDASCAPANVKHEAAAHKYTFHL